MKNAKILKKLQKYISVVLFSTLKTPPKVVSGDWKMNYLVNVCGFLGRDKLIDFLRLRNVGNDRVERQAISVPRENQECLAARAELGNQRLDVVPIECKMVVHPRRIRPLHQSPHRECPQCVPRKSPPKCGCVRRSHQPHGRHANRREEFPG